MTREWSANRRMRAHDSAEREVRDLKRSDEKPNRNFYLGLRQRLQFRQGYVWKRGQKQPTAVAPLFKTYLY